MPISTNLNVPPYSDTFRGSKDFYRWLFQPGVSVQARELNEIQSAFAAQIERFGDNVFKSGTIVSGCNFLFKNPYPYVKLQDQDVFGNPVTPSALVNNAIVNQTTGLRAVVLNYADGYVSSDPNLKTLYLNYLNTGYSSNQSAFSAGDTLTVYDPIRNGVERVLVTSGGSGFSNSNVLFAVPDVVVTPLTGTIANGQYIGNGLGANVQVVGVDSVTLAASGQLVLSVAPRPVDLANASLGPSSWTLANGQSITNSGNTASALVTGTLGYGFQGLPVTDASGTIQRVLVLNKGFGYSSIPYVTTQSPNNAGGYSSLQLAPQNFVSQVTVAATANAVGNGYAFGVNEGVIYLKGTLLRVEPQTVVVSKYDPLPDNVSVTFTCLETIVDANLDPSLNDPAAGDNNGAPGANRLKIVPQLAVVPTATAVADPTSVALVEWNAGNPYIQNQQTQYSTVGDAIAATVLDQSGDFYIDPFLVTTMTPSSTDANTLAFSVDVVVDPGSAYIQGYKVQTHAQAVLRAPLQAATVQTPYSVSMNYGNYVRVRELGGTFQFNTGDQVTLYSAAKGYVSNSALVKAGNTNPVGAAIGTAQIRNLQLASGNPGTNSAVYNLYLFDVQMNPGQNFASTRSVYYNGTQKGIADVVLTPDVTTLGGTNVCSVFYPNTSTLVFQTGFDSVKNANAASYQYSSLDQTVTVANSGVLTKSLASAGQAFPWPGATLIGSQLSQLYLAPTAVDLVSAQTSVGTWVSNTATANLVANTGTLGSTHFVAGDWMTLIGNTTQTDLKQVVQVVNGTFLVLDSAPSFANGSAVYARTYPKNLPIPLTRNGPQGNPTANVSANGTVLTINVGFPVNQAVSVAAVLGSPVAISNASPVTKTVNRNAFVKVSCANSSGNTVGPWCLGVPDVFRVRGVYVGNSTVDTTGTNYISMFAVDGNQKNDYLDLGWLYLQNQVDSPLTSGSYILVNFDYYTTTGSGFYATPSYTHSTNTLQILLNDSSPYQNLGSVASTWEIPEYFTDEGREVDLLGAVDFRPYAQATATPGSTPAGAPVNPGSVATFSPVEKLFPVPGAVFSANLEYYVPRIDSVYVDPKANVYRVQGASITSSGSTLATPPGVMKVADILFPAYPQLPATKSITQTQAINTRVVNNSRYQTTRVQKHLLSLMSTILQDSSKVYTNHDLASIDQRVRNLEYYVNLSQLETGLQTMVIPSSNDPTVNRYQFGFFADDFQTSALSDTTNPSYAAVKEGTDVVPTKMTWEVYLGDDFSGSQAYVAQTVISQVNATIGDHGDPTAVPKCAVTLANTVAYQLVYRTAFDYNHQAPQSGTVDIVQFTAADSKHMGAAASVVSSGVDQASTVNLGSGTVTLFFYAYDHPVQFQILQGSTVVADSSTAVALSANDVTNLTTGTVMNQWFNDQTSLFLKNPAVVNGAFVQYAGKVVWNYSGAGGNQISVRTTNGVGVENWRWVLSYPINGDTAGCVPPPPDHTCPSGYTYDATTGGCVLKKPVSDPGPPPITINWEGCGNHAAYWAQQILKLEAAGTRIGVININDGGFLGGASGSLADWLNPVSIQNQRVLTDELNSYGAVGVTEVQYSGSIATQINGGHYTVDSTTGSVYYTSPSGVTSFFFNDPGLAATVQALTPPQWTGS